MTANRAFHVIAPPPTPNGDLHVGHLSGPYFGADVFSRFQRLRGSQVTSALSIDENQSYVVTTAERLQEDPKELVARNYDDIRRTLQMAAIHFDTVGRPDEKYTRFVSDFFETLYAAGSLIEKQVQVYYNTADERYLFESYIKGRCPTCFDSTNGNICESCGHPNDPFTLIDAGPVNSSAGKDGLEIRTVRALFLPMESYRARIKTFFEESEQHIRPTLKLLLTELLQSPLQDFPVTYVSDWGIRIPFDGLESSVYNVWAEMYPGHLYWLKEAGRTATEKSADTLSYVQFLGFDNSYFYTIAHVALAMAAQDAGLSVPVASHFITNEFYLLDNDKFSTSRGHLIWGKELLSKYNADAVRFYLAYTNPETQQTNCSLDTMTAWIQTNLVDKFEKIRSVYNKRVGQGVITGQGSPEWNSWIQTFQHRFELVYSPDTFSLRTAAQTFVHYMDLVEDQLVKTEADRTSAGIGRAVAALALFAAPLMPTFASRLAEELGISGHLSWKELPVIGNVRPLPPGLITLQALAASTVSSSS
ncbi:class I tRNA ligase family protein [Paenibacillus lutrae]|nr:class I tRNA ligase family protein [Paenibacillus lutrae]